MDRIGIPVYISIRPDSKSLAVDSGKGTTPAQAKCSASMEALERWALDEVPIESFRAPGKTGLMNFALNRGGITDGERSSRLVNARNLRSGDEVRVPYFAVKLYEGQEPLQEKPWFASTNGMSAGNDREEAILSGIYEVIERDGVHLAMERTKAGTMLARVEEDSIDDPDCLELLKAIEDAGARVFIYDTRNECGVPTFQCLLVDHEKGIPLFKGYRCNPDKWIALCGSICEAAQSRAVVFAGARDDVTWAKHRRLVSDSMGSNWAALLEAEKNVISMEEIPNVERDIMEVMEEFGINPLVVDFPIPHLFEKEGSRVFKYAPFACVKVLVPGFASYWVPFAEPGRPSYGGGT
jgi:ribosomal protein S12 methylthiotransferase accessory factor